MYTLFLIMINMNGNQEQQVSKISSNFNPFNKVKERWMTSESV